MRFRSFYFLRHEIYSSDTLIHQIPRENIWLRAIGSQPPHNLIHLSKLFTPFSFSFLLVSLSLSVSFCLSVSLCLYLSHSLSLSSLSITLYFSSNSLSLAILSFVCLLYLLLISRVFDVSRICFVYMHWRSQNLNVYFVCLHYFL